MEPNGDETPKEDLEFLKNAIKELLKKKLENDNEKLDTVVDEAIKELNDKYTKILSHLDEQNYDSDIMKKEIEEMKLYMRDG